MGLSALGENRQSQARSGYFAPRTYFSLARSTARSTYSRIAIRICEESDLSPTSAIFCRAFRCSDGRRKLITSVCGIVFHPFSESCLFVFPFKYRIYCKQCQQNNANNYNYFFRQQKRPQARPDVCSYDICLL